MTEGGDETGLERTIEAIYSYFKGDQEFTELMRNLESFLGTGANRDPVFRPELENHFEIAGRLAETISPSPETRFRHLVEGPGNKFAVDRALTIVAQSAAAREAFGDLDGRSIDAPVRNRAMNTDGRPGKAPANDGLARLGDRNVIDAVRTCFQETGDTPAHRNFIRTGEDGQFISVVHDRACDVAILTLPTANWGDNIALMLQLCLGLSKSETEVLELMIEGRSNVEISKERSRSLDTVKSQTQSIFRKLGAASRVEAIQIIKDITSLAALSGEPAAMLAAGSERKGSTLPYAQDHGRWSVATVGGRLVSYVHYPFSRDRTAPSILSFHGLLQSPELSS